MIVIGLVIGFVLGLVVAAGLWATGRRPYLRVDFERHESREVVHHLVRDAEPQYLPPDTRPASARSALEPTPPAVLRARITDRTNHDNDAPYRPRMETYR